MGPTHSATDGDTLRYVCRQGGISVGRRCGGWTAAALMPHLFFTISLVVRSLGSATAVGHRSVATDRLVHHRPHYIESSVLKDRSHHHRTTPAISRLDRPHFNRTECALIGRSRGELGRFTVRMKWGRCWDDEIRWGEVSWMIWTLIIDSLVRWPTDSATLHGIIIRVHWFKTDQWSVLTAKCR